MSSDIYLIGTVLFFVIVLLLGYSSGKGSKIHNILPGDTFTGGVDIVFDLKYNPFFELYFKGPTRFPIIGSAIQAGWILQAGSINYEKFHKLCLRYGSTLGFQAGMQYFVVTEDYETAKELMSSEIWSARFPSHPMYKEFTFKKNLGVLTSYGPDWKEMRRFVTKKLCENGFGNLKVTDSFLAEELDHFVVEFDEFRKKTNDDICLHQYFNVSVFNIVWRFMANTRFSYDDPIMRRLLSLMETTNTSIQLGANPGYAFPFLRYIPGMTEIGDLTYCSSQIHEFFKKIMIERRKLGLYRTAPADFIDQFLLKIDEENGKHDTLYTDEQFLQCCLDLLIAGSDTTANSVEFAILYLIKYPEAQQKIQAEIDSVLGEINRLPSIFDRASMPYTEAVMWEILRLNTIIPINTRVSAHETQLNDCYVPQQALAIINLAQLHRDPDVWGDPETFRPERFLDENMNVVNEDKVLAFGSGKRLCIGIILAKMTWFTFVTTLLQRYTFEPSPTHPELSTVPKSGFANMPKPFYCVAKLRNR